MLAIVVAVALSDSQACHASQAECGCTVLDAESGYQTSAPMGGETGRGSVDTCWLIRPVEKMDAPPSALPPYTPSPSALPAEVAMEDDVAAAVSAVPISEWPLPFPPCPHGWTVSPSTSKCYKVLREPTAGSDCTVACAAGLARLPVYQLSAHRLSDAPRRHRGCRQHAPLARALARDASPLQSWGPVAGFTGLLCICPAGGLPWAAL